MPSKSDMFFRLSATEVSRAFSAILDRIERGERFVVHRRGREACLMSPPPVEGRRASECLSLLRGRGGISPDADFAADLADVVAGEVASERPSWGS